MGDRWPSIQRRPLRPSTRLAQDSDSPSTLILGRWFGARRKERARRTLWNGEAQIAITATTRTLTIGRPASAAFSLLFAGSVAWTTCRRPPVNRTLLVAICLRSGVADAMGWPLIMIGRALYVGPVDTGATPSRPVCRVTFWSLGGTSPSLCPAPSTLRQVGRGWF